jgi:hypothetical protein
MPFFSMPAAMVLARRLASGLVVPGTVLTSVVDLLDSQLVSKAKASAVLPSSRTECFMG